MTGVEEIASVVVWDREGEEAWTAPDYVLRIGKFLYVLS